MATVYRRAPAGAYVIGPPIEFHHCEFLGCRHGEANIPVYKTWDELLAAGWSPGIRLLCPQCAKRQEKPDVSEDS